jgi:hypothetical protein
VGDHPISLVRDLFGALHHSGFFVRLGLNFEVSELGTSFKRRLVRFLPHRNRNRNKNRIVPKGALHCDTFYPFGKVPVCALAGWCCIVGELVVLRLLGVVVFRVGCTSGAGCMATSVGVGPFGALATLPAASSQGGSVGKPSRTARSLRKSSCHGVAVVPLSSPSQRLRPGQLATAMEL